MILLTILQSGQASVGRSAHSPAFGRILFCVSSRCKVLHYLAGFKVIKQLVCQWEAPGVLGVFFIPDVFKVSFDLGLSYAWMQVEMWG